MQDESKTVEQRLARARALLELGRCHDALRTILPALAQDPANPAVLTAAAAAYAECGDGARAVELSRQAVAAAPDDSSTWQELAMSLHTRHRRKDTSAAVEAAQRGLALDVDSWHAHVVLATVGVGRRAARPAVLASAERAVELAPNDSMSHHVLARVLWDQHRAEESERALRRAMALNPSNAAALNDLGLMAVRSSDFDRSAQLYLNSVRTDPKSVAAINLHTQAWHAAWMLQSIVVGVWILATAPVFGRTTPTTLGMFCMWLVGPGVLGLLYQMYGADARRVLMIVARGQRLYRHSVGLGLLALVALASLVPVGATTAGHVLWAVAACLAMASVGAGVIGVRRALAGRA